ncbi:hypothetical protein QE357_004290 [Siphonobacter sp. BAB-5404]|nr:hypothetical protein [Siphonobacter sp. SORGH_AS_1065]MDR6197178.1 hypothetical protein [Siphonobacter sp. SORGH_AS_0500]
MERQTIEKQAIPMKADLRQDQNEERCSPERTREDLLER